MLVKNPNQSCWIGIKFPVKVFSTDTENTWLGAMQTIRGLSFELKQQSNSSDSYIKNIFKINLIEK